MRMWAAFRVSQQQAAVSWEGAAPLPSLAVAWVGRAISANPQPCQSPPTPAGEGGGLGGGEGFLGEHLRRPGRSPQEFIGNRYSLHLGGAAHLTIIDSLRSS